MWQKTRKKKNVKSKAETFFSPQKKEQNKPETKEMCLKTGRITCLTRAKPREEGNRIYTQRESGTFKKVIKFVKRI